MNTDQNGRDDTRNLIVKEIDDLVSDFLYYDRKEDEDLPCGAIESAVASGIISIGDIVATFSEHVRNGLIGAQKT